MEVLTYFTNFLDSIIDFIFDNKIIFTPFVIIIMYFVFRKPKHSYSPSYSSDYSSNYKSYSSEHSSSNYSSDSYYKTPKEVGDELEKECALLFEDHGFSVERRGLEMGVKDGGIDLIATNDNIMILIQCKNYKEGASITDKHLRVFYGDVNAYLSDNDVSGYDVYNFFVSRYSQLSYAGQKWQEGKSVNYFSINELEDFLNRNF